MYSANALGLLEFQEGVLIGLLSLVLAWNLSEASGVSVLIPFSVCLPGALVEAMRNGYWVILDELNLAPTDVLEALNRVSEEIEGCCN